MILRVSTTCCFLPCGSAGTVEASLKSSCPGSLEDHLGSLAPDLSLGGRVEEVDDAGHGRTLAAPAHHRRAPLTSVFSICRPSSLTCLWLGPIGRASSWDAGSSVVGDWLGRRSILLP